MLSCKVPVDSVLNIKKNVLCIECIFDKKTVN